MIVLSVQNLVKVFRSKQQPDLIAGVRGVSLDVEAGEMVGLIGESGCGKTTLGRCVARLADPDDGRIVVGGQDFGNMSGRDLRRFRKHVQIVFQKPENCLNPRMTVLQFISEAFRNFDTCPKGQEREKLLGLARLVGLKEEAIDLYPNQLSGGEKQRVAIIRALACEPSVIVLDEPTSALDVSVQAQVLKTLRELQAKSRTSFLFISHDVAVIRYMCSRVFVMYLGLIVEEGTSEQVFSSPKHPYTQALLAAVPRLDGHASSGADLKGELTAASASASGCSLRPRCPHAFDRCVEAPPLANVGDGHRAACWLLHHQSNKVPGIQ
jgi:peptide/nickel transport system ATP-binding protein/oligopeptide transport system ATP-binding protein